FKARDLDNNGVYEALQDKMFIGFSEPRYRMGLRNEINFLRNFSASVFIRAELGHMREFSPSIAEPSTFDRRSTANYPYWNPDNRTNDWPRLNLRTAAYGGGIRHYKPSSYVRIQDFSLGYSFPASLVKRLHVENGRVFTSIRNLYSFDNWPG